MATTRDDAGHETKVPSNGTTDDEDNDQDNGDKLNAIDPNGLLTYMLMFAPQFRRKRRPLLLQPPTEKEQKQD